MGARKGTAKAAAKTKRPTALDKMRVRLGMTEMQAAWAEEKNRETISRLVEEMKALTDTLQKTRADHDRLAKQAFLTAGRLARLAEDSKNEYGEKHLSHLATMIGLELENVAAATRPADWPVTDGEMSADPIVDFLRDCTVTDKTGRVPSGTLYRAFLEWASDPSRKPAWTCAPTVNGFTRAMLNLGWETAKDRKLGEASYGTYWKGLRLKPEGNADTDTSGDIPF